MEIRPIKTEKDYDRALRRVETLWEAPQGSSDSDELDVLATLIEAYEREHYPIDAPGPLDAIKFRLDQRGEDLRSLIGVIGQRTRVYEVMRGDRPLSLNMIRRLHKRFGIPAEVLIQPIRKTKIRKPTVCRARKHNRSAIRKSA
ncbi:MAG: helix-turn-helix domain-containing protein [Candidatus Acidiferrales bacterium]